MEILPRARLAPDRGGLVWPGPSSALMPAGDAAGWEYEVRTLELPAEAWAEQLVRWRRDGRELLTVAEVEGIHRALLERRR